MSIVSFSFAFFVLAVMVLYYIVPKRFKWVVLLVSSYLFYGIYSIKYLGLLIISTAITFYSALYIHKLQLREKEQKKESNKKPNKKRKRILILTLVINFSILAFFKYFNITVSGLYRLTGCDVFSGFSQLVLPLGISFYLFQTTGYLLDVYWKRCDAETNLCKFALFASFFPQIVQGPISRYKQLAPQLFEPHKWDDNIVRDGIYKILGGLFKKMIIADRLSILVNSVMSEQWKYSGSVLFFVILIYGVQIYCDFSGGISIISGVANLFSIQLTPNFNRPLLATSVGDFWRRWHITLGSWMRDYVFYPVSLSKWFGKVSKNARRILGPKYGKIAAVSVSSLIVYILVGIWHGSSLKYIAFGLWHGFFISLALFFEDFMLKLKKKLHMENQTWLWHLLGIVYTTIIVSLGRYFSRADSLMQALSMFKRTLLNFSLSNYNFGIFLNSGLEPIDLWIVGLSVAAMLVYEIAAEQKFDIKKQFEKRSLATQLIIVYLFLLFLIYAGFYPSAGIVPNFIYMQY